MILTPVTMSPMLAFLPRFRWTPQETRARRRCRVELVKLTREIGQRYAMEQAVEAKSDRINWRQS